MKKIVSGIMLTLLLTAMLTLAFSIQSAKAFETICTIYIRADGSVDPPTAPVSTSDNITYSFIDNITYTAYDTAIAIARDNIILDGNGYVLQGLGVGGDGIDLYYRSNVTIRNMKVEKFNYGIYLSGSSNNSIVECNITENVNGAGISIYKSPNNRIVKCNLTSNGFAISLSSSSNNMLKNNNMTDNYYSIAVWGDELSHFFQDMDESNTVNGKPTCYWINRRDMKAPQDVGYVALINSTNITVEGLELKNNGEGILLAYTTNSKITNNNLTDNKYGIRLVSSSLNIISRNNMPGNGDNGIYMESSLNNVLSLNRITYNGVFPKIGMSTGDGIRLQTSHNNTIFGNTITSNEGGGVSLESSKYNNIYRNEIITNQDGGIGLGLGSDNNMAYENDIISNYYGVWVYSKNNVFYHNDFIDNDQQVSSFNLTNVWDDGYPSGGNYWSDYAGVDSNGDGIGDTPYTIDANNRDRYPLMSHWAPHGHELAMSITASASIMLGGSSSLDAIVTNLGLNDEVDVEFLLLINSTVVNSITILLLQASNSYMLSYLWTPTVEGTYNITAYAHPVTGETSTENNQETKFVTVSAPPPLPEVQVGVKAGDWIKIEYAITGWPAGQAYPLWLKVEFLSVEGTNVTVRVTMRMSNGTEQNATVPVDVVAGGQAFGLSGFVIPANLTTGDSVYITGYGNVTIAGETTGTYAGASRTVVYTSFSQYGTQLTYYWDKQTGVMVEASVTSGTMTGTGKATETNMWQAAPSGLPIEPIYLYILAALVIIIAVGATAFIMHRKKKPPEEVESSQSKLRLTRTGFKRNFGHRITRV